MKKGLLTLLAAALTIVGCQDYDSQFKELTTLVTKVSLLMLLVFKLCLTDIRHLATTVDGLALHLTLLVFKLHLDELEAALVGVADETDLNYSC